ncbi:MAG TPA: PadR family transcriptional regulator [Phycisphaerae bacterium]|nr:PadR family transcriptional regulator [Phycisphaerae bacterium]
MSEGDRNASVGGWVTQLRKGLVELLVLAALQEREAYGYELLQRLSAGTGPAAGGPGMELTESTLYPVLARLAGEGLLAVRHAPSSSGPPRRYYRLTAAGGRRLRDMATHWRQVNETVELLVRGGNGGQR